MSIEQLLETKSFPPETVTRIKLAYVETLRSLQLVDRDEPLTDAIARKIVELAQTDVGDPDELSRRTIRELDMT